MTGIHLTLLTDDAGIVTNATFEYEVTINGLVIARGLVEGHDRSSGWEHLIRRVADQETCRRLSSST